MEQRTGDPSGRKHAREVLPEAWAGGGIQFGQRTKRHQIFGPGRAELNGWNDLGLGCEDRQTGEPQFGAKEMAEGGEDLVGLSSTLNRLGEIQEAIDRRRSLRQGGAGCRLDAHRPRQIHHDAQTPP